MRCATHSEAEATAFCRSCGKAVCAECIRDEQGVAYCSNCTAEPATGRPEILVAAKESPYLPPAASGPAREPGIEPRIKSRAALPAPELRADTPSPFLAFVLGLIPGVGAVYNGHYAKAVFHVFVFGGTVTLIGSRALRGLEPLLVLFALMFFIYMPIEACRTAKALRRGEPVDEFSGLLSLVHEGSRSPVVGITLIAFGVVFLLHSLGYWRIPSLIPYWPRSASSRWEPICSTGASVNLRGSPRRTTRVGSSRHRRTNRRAAHSHASNPGHGALNDGLAAADPDGTIVSVGVRRLVPVRTDLAFVANRAGRRPCGGPPDGTGRGPEAGDLA